MKLDEAHQKITEWLQNNCDAFTGTRPNDLKAKIDFLERALEILRYKNKHLDNKLEFEEFVQGQIVIDNEKLTFESPQKLITIHSGTKPIRLQTKLLMFLLLNHDKSYKVYDIIDNFISKIWGHLTFIDFKKTKTGVTRCFTNTRFAANTLRDYGLLKFTKKERYKTWTLSLYGFLVAADTLEKNLNWKLSKIENDYPFAINPDILNSCNELKSYSDFVKKLESICKSEKTSGVFKTFDDVLKEAYRLLGDYKNIVQNSDLSVKKRQEESLAKTKQLESLSNIEEFYEEFSTCIYVDTFLKELMNE